MCAIKLLSPDLKRPSVTANFSDKVDQRRWPQRTDVALTKFLSPVVRTVLSSTSIIALWLYWKSSRPVCTLVHFHTMLYKPIEESCIQSY